MLLQVLHQGRRLIERLETELLFCWFVGLSVDDAVWWFALRCQGGAGTPASAPFSAAHSASC
jgi:hypothetical protein